MSEAMHGLGIESTRALALIGSEHKVYRETWESGAIVLRVSPSWVRFGTFEYFAHKKRYTELEALADYGIAESYPHLVDEPNKYLLFFTEVVGKTAILMAQWQAVGFNHGVMNTDNMSIEGLTIDYGPYAMLDDFNYNYVCNHTDRAGRYSYGEQPNISYWNLTKLSEALSPLIDAERMKAKLKTYGESIFPDAYISVMCEKVGLLEKVEGDAQFVESLVVMLHEAYVDHTLFFRTLSRYDGDRSPLYDIAMEPVVVDEWLKLYDIRLSKETRSQSARHNAMLKTNPKYILKNYMLQKAIELAERGDYSMVEDLLYIASHPYEELPEFEHFLGDTPEEHKNIGLSCSS